MNISASLPTAAKVRCSKFDCGGTAATHAHVAADVFVRPPEQSDDKPNEASLKRSVRESNAQRLTSTAAICVNHVSPFTEDIICKQEKSCAK